MACYGDNFTLLIEIPTWDVTIADKIALLNKLQTSRLTSTIANWFRWLECINLQLHELCNSKKNFAINVHHVIGSKKLGMSRNMKVRIKMLKNPKVSGPLLKRKSGELARQLGHNDYRGTAGRLSHQKCWFSIVLTQRSRVWFPALPDFLSSTGSGTGSAQPLCG
jgi:hypothetical protein